MIFAELQGKLGQHHSRAHERAEDVLTSTVFGLLRYLPLSDWLGPLAGRIRPIQKHLGPKFPADGTWLDVRTVATCEFVLWHRLSPYGEPDVVLLLRDAQERLLHLLVIEVKLYSPKSGSASKVAVAADDDDAEEELAGIDKDQLVRYWCYACAELARLQKSQPGGASDGVPATASLVYLTAHSAPPSEELLISLAAGGSSMRLGWLSWFDIWQVAHAAGKLGKSLPAADLEALLAHKGFRRFVGFHDLPCIPGLASEKAAQFWRHGDWFCSLHRPPVGSAKFWNPSDVSSK